MDTTAAKKILAQKEPTRLYDVVEPVLASAELRAVLVDSAFDKNETLRYNCVRVMFRAMDQQPELFYPYWDRFAEMIDSPNGFHRSAAAQAIAFLSIVDADCRLDRIFTHYLRLLDDSKVMVSHYFIDTLDRICRARIDLQPRIIKALLGIDRTHHTPERRELLKATVLAIFDRLYDALPEHDRKQAVAFAHASLQSVSGKTRKAAKSFLATHEAQLVLHRGPSAG
jgi:hypothetical protein